MEFIDNLALGISVAASWKNLLYAFSGCLLGTMIGVLPGIGPLATIAMLLPFTFHFEPVSALIMLAGIYYGAAYGGSTTAILVNLPGEASTVVTCIDGYQMARQGRAGIALSTAALGSFFAGCVGTLLLAAFAVPLSEIALNFNSPEYFSLMVLGLVGAAAMSSGSQIKAIAMILLGIALGLIGLDINSGIPRFTFGFIELWDGLDFVSVALGLFAITEIASNLEKKERREVLAGRISKLWPTRDDFSRMWRPMVRGTALGAVLGVLPGAGPMVSSFGAYAVERRFARHPEQFGKGAIEGVAGPEAANNAAAQCAFIPTLTLGIPGSATMTMMLAAMMIHNIQPGPRVISSNPDLFWGLIVSMWIGNLMLLVLNLPLVGLWAKVMFVPYFVLYPVILGLCCIGVYAVSGSTFFVSLTALFGVVGYLLSKLRCEPAPLILGFVLGPMLEENFRRSLVVARGDFSIFFTHPVSLGLLVAALFLVIFLILPSVRGRKELSELRSRRG